MNKRTKAHQFFQLSFNASLKTDFQGSRATSHGGLRTIEFGDGQVYVIAHPSVKSKILARMRSSCGRTLRRNHMGI
jgi:hypothetical protein